MWNHQTLLVGRPGTDLFGEPLDTLDIDFLEDINFRDLRKSVRISLNSLFHGFETDDSKIIGVAVSRMLTVLVDDWSDLGAINKAKRKRFLNGFSAATIQREVERGKNPIFEIIDWNDF